MLLPAPRRQTKPGTPRLQRRHRLAQGLVGAWLCDDRAGTTLRDRSLYRRDGSLVNGPTHVLTRYGWGVQCDGTNDYLNLANEKLVNDTSGTFTALARINNLGAGTGTLLGLGGGPATGGALLSCQFRTQSGNVYMAVAQRSTDGSDAAIVYGSTPLVAGREYTMTWKANGNGKGWALYLDGKPETVNVLFVGNLGRWFSDTNPSGTLRTSLMAGQFEGAMSGWVAGTLIAAWLWNRPLTDREIAQHALDPWEMFRAPLAVDLRYRPVLQQLALTAAVTVGGSLQRTTRKTLATGSALIGQVRRSFHKALAASVARSGTLAKRMGKTLTASSGLTATLTRGVRKTLTAGQLITATLRKRTTQTLAASVNTASSLSLSRVLLLTLTAAVGVSGSVRKQARKALSASISTTATLRKRSAKTLQVTLAVGGTLRKRVSKTLRAVLSVGATLTTIYRQFVALMRTRGGIRRDRTAQGIRRDGAEGGLRRDGTDSGGGIA